MMYPLRALVAAAAAGLLLLAPSTAPGQLSGTRHIPGDYPALADAINDLNAQGVGAGGVTLNLVAGNPQTAPPGGFVVTATGTAGNPIVINGNGNTVTAGLQAAAGAFDAIFRLHGSDYVTLQGFVLQENAANTVLTPATNTMTEFGVLLVHASATDGCQNNTIQHNTISLRATYVDSIGIFSTSASSPSNAALDATSTAGTNSNNRIYGNAISNVAYGVLFVCPPVTATVFESGNDIGGTSAATGNTVSFGNATTSSSPWNRATALGQSGIALRNGAGNSVRFNQVTSTALSYVGAGLLGIGGRGSTSPVGVTYTSVYSDNTVTLNTTSATLCTGLDFGHGIVGATGSTLTGERNAVTINQTLASAASVTVTGLKSDYPCAARSLGTNQVTVNQTTTSNGTSGTVVGFATQGTTTATSLLSNNTLQILQSTSGTGTNSTTVTGFSSSGNSTNRTIQGNSIVLQQSTSVANGFTGAVQGMICAAAASSSLNISGGNVVTIRQLASGAGSFGSAAVFFVSFNAAHGGVTISGNTFNTSGGAIRSSGALNVLLSGGAVTLAGTLTISNNTAAVTRTAATGAVGFFTQTSTVPNDPTDVITGNDVQFDGLVGTTSVIGIQRLGGAVGNTRQIANNFVGVSGTNSGVVTGILSGFCATASITGNTVNLDTASTASTCISANANTIAATLSGNTISLHTSSVVPTSAVGLNVAGSGAHVVSGNIFRGTQTRPSRSFPHGGKSNGVHCTANLTTFPTCSALTCSNGNGAVISGEFCNVIVGDVASTGEATAVGAHISGGLNIRLTRCEFFDIHCGTPGTSSRASGVRCTGGAFVQFDNSRCSEIYAPRASGNAAVVGLAIVSVQANSTYRAYYNVIYLAATSSGSNFGSACFYAAASNTSTTANFEFSCNILRNDSEPTGSGYASCFERSSGATANWDPATNNNLFSAGAKPGGLIFNDNIDNYVFSLNAYQALVAPRDSASGEEEVVFASTDPAEVNYLWPNEEIPTFAEGGGRPIAGLTTDCVGDPRHPTGPDIGCREFTGLPLDAPQIVAPQLADTSFVTPRLLTFTVASPASVPTSGNGLPRVYWKVGVGGNYVPAVSVHLGGDQYQCSFGGSAPGSTVYYYVAAQNASLTPRIVTKPLAGAAGFTADPPAASTPPTEPWSYVVHSGLSGLLTVGSGGQFSSLTNPGGLFEATSGQTLNGDLDIRIVSNLTGETGTHPALLLADALQQFRAQIQPFGGPRTIIGSVNGPLLFLTGSARYVLQGSLTEGPVPPVVGGDATRRQLTVENQNTGSNSVVLASDATTAVGNGFFHLDLRGVDRAVTAAGLVIGGATVGSGGPQPGVRVENIAVTNVRYGIHLQGTSESQMNPNAVVTKSKVNNVGRIGIYLGSQIYLDVSNNFVFDVICAGEEDAIAISAGHESWAVRVAFTRHSAHAKFERNYTQTTVNTNPAGGSAIGMAFAGSPAGPLTIVNNVVVDVRSTPIYPAITAGYVVSSTLEEGALNFLHNTARLDGQRLFPTVVPEQSPSYALAIDWATGIVYLRNNLLVNRLSATNGSPAALSHAVGFGNPNLAGVDSDYHLLHVAGPLAGGIQKGGGLAPNAGVVYPTVPSWFAASGLDGHSLGSDPLFVEPGSFAIAQNSPAANAGTPLPGLVTADIHGNLRSLIFPEIGALELARSALLAALLANGGVFTPSFDPGTFSYTTSLANEVASIALTPTLLDTNATVEVQINGGAFVPVVSGQSTPLLPLSVGPNSLVLRDTAEFGSPVQSYFLTVNRNDILVAPTLNLTTAQGYPRVLAVTDILAGAVYSPSFPPVVDSAGPATQQGGTVTLQPGVSITYRQPVPVFFGPDSFLYILRNSFGQTATGTVNIQVVPPPFPPRPVQLFFANSVFNLAYDGVVPGTRYRIEYSTDLLNGEFVPLLTGPNQEPLIRTATENGLLEIMDELLPPELITKGFFRAVLVP